jgi:hypothetical protein
MTVPNYLIKLPVEDRYQFICRLWDDWGDTVGALACKIGICANTIRSALHWRQHQYSLGHPGRPPKLGEEQKIYIRIRTENDRHLSNADLAREVSDAFPELNGVSEEIVRKCRNDMGLHYLPMLQECRMSSENLKSRVKWCEDHRGTNWNNVVFSDESWFETGARKRWLWRHRDDDGSDVCYSRKAHPEKVMIWGAVGFNFKSSLHFVKEDSVTSDYYFNEIIIGRFLDEVTAAYGHRGWVFQQDNARPHVSKKVIQGLQFLDIQMLTPWPAYSPDLNIIERVWAICKNRIAETNAETLDQLKEIVQSVWDNLTFQTINALVAEMPRRLEMVIARDGRTIQRLRS